MKSYLFLLFALPLLLISCGENYVPKPRAYIRVDFPEKNYRTTDLPCAYNFDIPGYATLKKAKTPCNYTVWMPKFKGEIFLAYTKIDEETTLQVLLDEMHKMAYQHQIKASAINSKTRTYREDHKYVLEYKLTGNVASSYQFAITDSVSNFVHGSLYFRARPNPDSIKPVLEFIEQDIDRIIESFEWTEPINL